RLIVAVSRRPGGMIRQAVFFVWPESPGDGGSDATGAQRVEREPGCGVVVLEAVCQSLCSWLQITPLQVASRVATTPARVPAPKETVRPDRACGGPDGKHRRWRKPVRDRGLHAPRSKRDSAVHAPA